MMSAAPSALRDRVSKSYDRILADFNRLRLRQIKVLGRDPWYAIEGDYIAFFVSKRWLSSKCFERLHARTIHSTDEVRPSGSVFSLNITGGGCGLEFDGTARILLGFVSVGTGALDTWLIGFFTGVRS